MDSEGPKANQWLPRAGCEEAVSRVPGPASRAETQRLPRQMWKTQQAQVKAHHVSACLHHAVSSFQREPCTASRRGTSGHWLDHW